MKTMNTRFHTLLEGGLVLLFSLAAISHAGAQTCVQPPSGLVSWWPGDGNALDIVGGNNGTLKNGASFAVGKVGQALNFDGVDDAFVTPLVVSYSTGASFDAWVMTLDDRGIIMSGGGGATLERGMGIFIEPGGILSLFGTKNIDSQLNFLIQAGSISDGTFHHVAATWTGDTTPDGVRLYVDGVLVGMATAATSISMDSLPLQVGGHTTLAHHKLAGVIDEVEVFSRVLSPSEIQAIFNAGSAGKCKADTVLDHFKCYKAKGEPRNVAVALEDQFGVEAGVLVKKPEFFCNPVDKNGEGIRNPTAHLTCYKIKADGGKRDVVIENQFGGQTLKVNEPDLLCVPSDKIDVIP